MASSLCAFAVASYTSYPPVERLGAFGYGDYLRALAPVRARGALHERVLHLQPQNYGAGAQPAGLAAKTRKQASMQA